MKKLLVILSMFLLVGCSNKLVYADSKNKITISHDRDTISEVVFDSEYPIADSQETKEALEEKLKESYLDEMKKDYGDGVTNVEVKITGKTVHFITTLDMKKISNLKDFGIESTYPSLKEFETYLIQNGYVKK